MGKDLKRVLIILGVIVFVLLIGVVLALGSTGFVPIVSDLMGTNKPRDLGVSFSGVDYSSGLAKVPWATVINPEYLCIGCEYSSTGSIPKKTLSLLKNFQQCWIKEMMGQ